MAQWPSLTTKCSVLIHHSHINFSLVDHKTLLHIWAKPVDNFTVGKFNIFFFQKVWSRWVKKKIIKQKSVYQIISVSFECWKKNLRFIKHIGTGNKKKYIIYLFFKAKINFLKTNKTAGKFTWCTYRWHESEFELIYILFFMFIFVQYTTLLWNVDKACVSWSNANPISIHTYLHSYKNLQFLCKQVANLLNK